MTEISPSFGNFFEDIEVDEELETSSRTITETDIVNFAGLSGDFNPMHMDEEFASQTIFKGRIAHGLLVLSIATGLLDRVDMWTNTIIAFLGLSWEFQGPVMIGDTIRVKLKVIEKKDTSKPDRGIIKLFVNVLNQRDESVQTGEWTAMISRRVKSK